MDQRISFVTLAVADLAASRRFYLDGLGWRAELDVPGEVLMIRVGEHLILSLWDATEFEGEVGPLRRGEGLAPITLAHNVARPEEVDEILAEAGIGADDAEPESASAPGVAPERESAAEPASEPEPVSVVEPESTDEPAPEPAPEPESTGASAGASEPEDAEDEKAEDEKDEQRRRRDEDDEMTAPLFDL